MKANGFTLIELMITVAIIAILSAIAIPAYQASSTRAKISEALILTSTLKNMVSEAYLAGGMTMVVASAQEFNTAPIIEKQTKYISNIVVNNEGVITITLSTNAMSSGFPNDVLGKTIVLTPNINGMKLTGDSGTIDWACATITSNTATARGLVAELGTLATKYVAPECQ